MGCGFSTEDTKASDEEAILKSSDGVTGKTEQTTAQTRMGGALAKKSPAKKRRGDSKGKGKEQGDFLTSLTFIFVFFLLVVTASVTRKRADIIYKYFLMFILK